MENLSLNIGGIKASGGEAVVTLIWFKDRETVRIASGDNRGKLFIIPMWFAGFTALEP